MNPLHIQVCPCHLQAAFHPHPLGEGLKVKEEKEKAGLKLIQKMKIMASGPITSWQIDGGNSGNRVRLYVLGSKITADGDCSHEIKRCLLLGRKVVLEIL